MLTPEANGSCSQEGNSKYVIYCPAISMFSGFIHFPGGGCCCALVNIMQYLLLCVKACKLRYTLQMDYILGPQPFLKKILILAHQVSRITKLLVL